MLICLSLAFRCAYCNYLNSAPKKKSIVHNNTIIHGTQATKISQSTNESTAEHMERCSSQLDHSDESTVFVFFYSELFKMSLVEQIMHQRTQFAMGHVDQYPLKPSQSIIHHAKKGNQKYITTVFIPI